MTRRRSLEQAADAAFAVVLGLGLFIFITLGAGWLL
jgi:hypothetical protein